ncbi:MBL fold metallo-hydrolase [Aneurinibacillus terranovensis]|uniref:MBL fold metallo-hydrolase n=1 Tax=Aneurinibacillus terranovensis TaxID=278991 RepID=UPI000402184F|nr:MBL fold metallo-hydrolase [Aneurinibacillus terranovensis]
MAKKRYYNLDRVPTSKSVKHIYRWGKSKRIKAKKTFSFSVPLVDSPEIDFLRQNRTSTTITWIGHSTFLIQAAGLNIITDPVWAQRMGLYKRLTPPGIALSAMPAIDVVLISHGHFDHLNVPSLRGLKGNRTHLVPEGLRFLLRRKGFHHVEEFSWWDRQQIGDLELVFVPAQHWTKRGLFDTNTSHWGGWVIHNNRTKETIYFAGDSGYFRGFAEIGKRFSIDYVLMPIGAYDPEWFMAPQHVSPEQATQAFLDTHGKFFVPMHYGTFRLANDTPQEALDRLLVAWDKKNISHDQLKFLKLGETLHVGVQ